MAFGIGFGETDEEDRPRLPRWGGRSGREAREGWAQRIAGAESVARLTLVLSQLIYFISSWKLLGFFSPFGHLEIALQCF